MRDKHIYSYNHIQLAKCSCTNLFVTAFSKCERNINVISNSKIHDDDVVVDDDYDDKSVCYEVNLRGK